MKKDRLTLRDLALDDLHGIFELAAKLNLARSSVAVHTAKLQK